MRKAKSIFQGKNEPVWVRPISRTFDRYRYVGGTIIVLHCSVLYRYVLTDFYSRSTSLFSESPGRTHTSVTPVSEDVKVEISSGRLRAGFTMHIDLHVVL